MSGVNSDCNKTFHITEADITLGE